MKTAINYTLIGLALIAAAALSFFHSNIESSLTFLPSAVIPAVSVVAIVSATCYFWLREHRSEILKEEFVTVITHKFRTPITGIKWAIQTLQGDVNYQVREDLLKEMERASQRIVEIVDLVTGFGKIDGEGDYSYIVAPIRGIVDASLVRFSQAIRESGATFRIDAPENIPPVKMDKAKMQFVMDILLENAIKYSPKGGAIHIGISFKDGWVTLALKDSGIGMSRKELTLVFRRFWRSNGAKKADTEGMGLGLHTAKNIVEKHHEGRMWAESEGEGKGSTFFISIKAA